jgi:hypothetical protein
LEDFLQTNEMERASALSMPIRFEYGAGFGGEAHAVQAIATWAALAGGNSKILRMPSAFNQGEHTRERFASTLPGMAGIYFSDAVESGDFTLSRYQALELVAPRVAAMKSESFGDTVRGQGVALCCFASAKSEFLPVLYTQPRLGAVRAVSDIRVLIERLLHHLGERISRSINYVQLDHLASLVYQLFLNADEHGAYGVDGNRCESAIRGISIKHTVVSRDGVHGADGGLQFYLNRILLQEPDQENIRLVEISVFDTGPGMALRWLGERGGVSSYDDISVEAELDAVRTCFRKHMTTKSGKFYGEGLSMALRAMKQLGAFMTLRTGRLSLFQDFMHRDTVDFAPTSRFPNRELRPIYGTGYTICFRVR